MRNRLFTCLLALAVIAGFSSSASGQQIKPKQPAPVPQDFEGLARRFEAEKNMPYNKRYQTINAFSSCKDPRALDFLMKKFPVEKDTGARRAILNAIGSFKNSRAVDFLMKLYDDPEMDRDRNSIVNALGRSEDPRIFGFLSARYEKEKDAGIRRNIVQALGRIKTKECGAFLLQKYRKESDASVRSAAARALSRMADVLPLEALKEIILVEDVNARKSVAAAIAKLATKEAIEVLLDAYAKEWPYDSSKASGKPSKKRSANQQKAQSRKLQFAAAISSALSSITDNKIIIWLAEEVLASGEKHHVICREVVVPLVGEKKEKRAGDNLIEILRKGEDHVRRLAALALVEIDYAHAVPDLIEAADTSRNADVRMAAIFALGEFADTRARELLLRLAGDSDWKVKAAAVRALGSFPGKGAIDEAARALKDRKWQVQLAGVETLRSLRAKECVGPLIDALKKAEGRIRIEILNALRDIMDMDLGKDHKEWAKWWKENAKGFLVLPKEKTEETAEEGEEGKEGKTAGAGGEKKDSGKTYKTSATPASTPKFFGTEVVSSRVIFIIDISGSMSGAMTRTAGGRAAQGQRKVDYAKNELIGAVQKLSRKTYFNLYFFDTSFTKWKQQMVKATGGAKSSAIKWVQSMQPRGGTNIYDTLEDALFDPNVDTIYLLSDGQPGSGKWTRADDILREVGKINQHRKVQINTISFGNESELMKKLAGQNGGQYIKK